MRQLVIPPAPDYPGSLGDKSIMLSVANDNMDIAVGDVTDIFWQNLGFNNVVNIKNIDQNLYDEVYFYPTDTIDGAFGESNIYTFKNVSDLFRHKPIFFKSFSYGSSPIAESVKYIKELNNAKFSLRDYYSLCRFRTFFPDKSSILEIDPAFNLPSKQPNEPKCLSQKSVGICPANREYEKYANIIELCIKKEYDPVLMVNDLRHFVGDINLCDKLSQKYLCPIIKTYDPREIKYYISQMNFVITGRMHVAIYALSLNIKVYGFDYNEKMRGIFKLKQQEHNVIHNIGEIDEFT